MAFELAKKDLLVSTLPDHEDEQVLVERAKRDPNAFGELYSRFFLKMYKFVYSRMRDHSIAEDVTQEVFMKALKSIGRYQDTGKPFAAWLYQIAFNSIADRYRAAKPTEDIDEQYNLSLAGPGLEDVAGQRDELRRIWSIIEALPAQQRTAMVLKFQEDLKIEDIATVMGKTAGAVKLLIHRGVTRVRLSVQ